MSYKGAFCLFFMSWRLTPVSPMSDIEQNYFTSTFLPFMTYTPLASPLRFVALSLISVPLRLYTLKVEPLATIDSMPVVPTVTVTESGADSFPFT